MFTVEGCLVRVSDSLSHFSNAVNVVECLQMANLLPRLQHYYATRYEFVHTCMSLDSEENYIDVHVKY